MLCVWGGQFHIPDTDSSPSLSSFASLNFLFEKHNHQNNHNRNHKDILSFLFKNIKNWGGKEKPTWYTHNRSKYSFFNGKQRLTRLTSDESRRDMTTRPMKRSDEEICFEKKSQKLVVLSKS